MQSTNPPSPASATLPLGLTITALTLVLSAALPAQSATHFVAFGGTSFTFRPSVLHIQAGDTVIWTNAGGFHTVTGLGSEALCGSTAYSALGAGCTNRFDTSGSFAYQCNFHASLGMTGLIEVAASSPMSPTLTNVAWLTNGFLTFTVLSTANQTNVIQASTNLADTNDWVSLMTNVPSTNRFSFSDSNSPYLDRRYYRVIIP